MGKTPKTHENRSLIHILIGKVEDDPDVEFRAITRELALLILVKANGNKELLNAVQTAWKKSPPQKRREVENKGRSKKRRKRKTHDPVTARCKARLATIEVEQAKAHGPSWTVEEIHKRAKEILA